MAEHEVLTRNVVAFLLVLTGFVAGFKLNLNRIFEFQSARIREDESKARRYKVSIGNQPIQEFFAADSVIRDKFFFLVNEEGVDVAGWPLVAVSGFTVQEGS